MRKFIYLRLLLSVVCIVSGIYLKAQETVFSGSCGATENDHLTWTLDTQSKTLTINGTGAMTDYDNADNKAPWLAYDDESLTYLKLGEGLTHIGDYAFYDRTYLNELRIPTTVTSIGNYAFYRCLAMYYVWAMPETAPTLESNAFSSTNVNTFFYNHKDTSYDSGLWATYFRDRYQVYIDKVGENLYSIVSPNSINGGRHIITGHGAMYDYNNISSIPPYKTWISQYPCNQLIIEAGITHIGDYAFNNMTNYTSYSTPSSITSIGDHAFENCFPTHNSNIILMGSYHNITHIGDYAFSGCKGGTIYLPLALVHIGEGAFYGCEALNGTLSIPEQVEYIGNLAFAQCTNLTGDLTIPNSVTYLGEQAFSDCYNLNGHLTLSANIEHMGEMPFNMCSGITGVTIPEGITTISQYAFNWCSSIRGDLIIPNTVTSIGKYAFNECGFDGTLTISENMTEIEEGIFYACRNLTGSIVIPDNIVSIGSNAFCDCGGFTGELVFPENINYIGPNAFTSTKIEGTLTIPSKVTSINLSCFSSTNITELILHDGITNIGYSAFNNCSSLSTVTSLAITAPTLETNAFTGIATDAVLYYPEAGEQSYTDNGWIQYFSEINNQMCGDFAFYDIDLTTGRLTISGSGAMWNYDGTTQAPWRQYSTQITSVEIQNGITSIGKNAFYGMSAISNNVIIPSSVTLINEYAFALCTGITELTLYEGLTNIADYAFYNCASLNKVISLATTAPYFGSNVFDNISSDAALFCPTESEEDYIEKGWDNYFSINASDIYGGQCGENITWLFTSTTGELKITGTGEMWDYEDYESSDERTPWNQYSKDIKSLILSEGITHIGSNAFRGLTVGALVLPSTTESIGRFGFFAFGSDTIGTLVLPEKIVSMGANAFNASRFTGTLNIPNSVTTISAGTFSNCHFTEINLSENMTDIPYCCFLSNSKLTTVKIPAGITKIDEKAFYDCPAIINCTILATTAPTLDEDIFSSEIYENAYLYYHADATDYEEKGWFDYFANRNPIYTGTCGENAYWTLNMTTCLLNIYGTGAMNNFSSSTNPSYSPYKQYIKSVIIEEGITNVGNLAFIDCTEITEFTLASTVTSIGNYAFRNCTGLTGKIIIPSNVISIGSYAFSSCTGITGLKIEGSASIGDYAFYNCTGLQSISNSDISKLVSIGDYAFTECTGLTSIAIPHTVESIGSYAFYECTELTTLAFIPRTQIVGRTKYYFHDLSSIGNYAFSECSKLVGVTKDISSGLPGVKPEEVTALFIPFSVQTIGISAFENCTSIPELRFETGGRPVTNLLTSIGDSAFENCSNIMGDLNLSMTKLTKINSYAFYGCRFERIIDKPRPIIIGGTLSLPNTILEIEPYAFHETGFRTANFPETLTKISSSAFAGTSLTNLDLSKTNVNHIGNNAFENCTKLSSLLLPFNDQQILSIEGGSFKGCTSLKEVIIPHNVTRISYQSFSECTALEKVILPNELEIIENKAFDGCNNIKEVYATAVCAGSNFYNSLSQGAFSVNLSGGGKAILYYPKDAEDCYIDPTYDSQWEIQFPIMIEGIFSGKCGDNAYYIGNNSSIYYHQETQTTYEKRSEMLITGYGDMYNFEVDNIPWRSMYVDTVKIANGITSIGDYAFYRAYVLNELIGGSGISYVGDYAFYNCSNLLYKDFICNASYIGDYAFHNCEKLSLDTELNLNNATYIGDYAFYKCTGLTGNLKISNATSIGDYAFYQTNFTGELVIPNSVSYLGECAFYGCNNFNGTLTLSENLEKINKHTFYNCSGLTGNLVIPENVSSIGEHAFYSCFGFTDTLVIPENVSSIGANAFYSCSGFTGLKLNENITSISNKAFDRCTGLSGELVLPNKLSSIGNSAFYNVPFTDVITFRTEPASLGTDVFNAITGNIYIPYQFKEAYHGNANWSNYSDKIVNMPTYTPLTATVNHWVGLSSGIEPATTDKVALNATLVVEANKTLSVESFGHCGLDNEIYGHLHIKDGGQLIHNKGYNTATMEKNILGYAGEENNGTKWFTISSPLKSTIDLSSDSNPFVVSVSYDLYRYDEPSFTWQNSKSGDNSSNFQTIDPGRGYLYASEDDVTLEFSGHLNTEAVSYNLTAQGEQLTGFHLIGNPFAHDITTEHFLIGDSLSLAEGYYVLTGEGSWSATPKSVSENIKPGQGVLIKTTADGELTISRQKSVADKGHERNQLSSLSINVNNDKYSDKAFVIFNKGIGLDKINHKNEEIPLLYIPVCETDFAIAMIDKNSKEIPVNFETNVMGEYTISLQQENCNFKKLYLLDKETKEIVNILEENYTFIATSNDSPERFILTFENDNDNEHFAYINNGDIVIYNINALNGAADIRIIDALGRCVYNGMFVEETNRISTSKFSSGVYIIEKSDDDGINVQKIII